MVLPFKSRAQAVEQKEVMAYLPHESDKIKAAIIKSIRKGATRDAASGAAGISRSTLYEWMKTDSEFANHVSEAAMAAVHDVEDALYRSATEADEHGKRNVTAQIFFLKNRANGAWRDVSQIDARHSGEVGVQIVFSDEGVKVDGKEDGI